MDLLLQQHTQCPMTCTHIDVQLQKDKLTHCHRRTEVCSSKPGCKSQLRKSTHEHTAAAVHLDALVLKQTLV